MSKMKPDGEGASVKVMGSSSVVSRLNRTFICSVVFLDIVDYSTKSVDEQIRQKDQLNKFVVEAIKDVAVNDRIILDTGDGAAIGFLGDPEDALFVALSLRDALLEHAKAGNIPFSVRMGMNLGPVKLVKDINGRPNLIGDGINVAQRVMAFAQPGQVLVSRSYYEVVSCLSQEYANLFHYLGMKADKHIREHEIYVVDQVKPAAPKAAHEEKGSKTLEPAAEAPSPPGGSVPASAPAPAGQKSALKSEAPAPKAKSPVPPKPGAGKSRKFLFVAAPIAVALIVAAVFLLKPKPSDAPAEDVSQEGTIITPTKAEEPPEKKGLEDPVVSKQTTMVKAAQASAFIILEIKPKGDVYVDGKMEGTTPPMEFVKVPPGPHKIEIRSVGFDAYKKDVDLKPSENIKISHVFKK